MLGGNGGRKGSSNFGDWTQKQKDEYDELKRREEDAKRRSRECHEKAERLEAARQKKKDEST